MVNTMSMHLERDVTQKYSILTFMCLSKGEFQRYAADLQMHPGANLYIQILIQFAFSYTNNRTNSFVEDGVLYLKPTFAANLIGEEKMKSGGKINLW